jgi:hypothetical protein
MKKDAADGLHPFCCVAGSLNLERIQLGQTLLLLVLAV